MNHIGHAQKTLAGFVCLSILLLASCQSAADTGGALQQPVGERPAEARAADGNYIHWHEHLIDDAAGLVMGDLDGGGDIDSVGTRGNSYPYDGVFWLEQLRSPEPAARFTRARTTDSEEVALP